MSTARTRANRRYNEKTYDQIKIQAKKGVRAQWREEAEKRGLSLASFIMAAVAYYVEHSPAPPSAIDNEN